MTFGDVNHDEYVGNLYDFPLYDTRYWAPHLSEFVYGEKVLGNWYSFGTAVGILDTGTSMISVPKSYHQYLE